MSFKDNLKDKINLDRLLQKLIATIKEPPGRRWVDKVLIRKLLDMTDFRPEKIRDLQLYVRPLKGEIKEVLVLDNELPLYHTTVADVVLRKSPHWKEIVSLRNIRKIMYNQDVIISQGKDSLKHLHASALALLDLTYTRDDLTLLLEDARQGMGQKSIEQVRESLDLFLELLDFQPVSLKGMEQDYQIFVGPKLDGVAAPAFEHLLLFDEESLSLGLKKGAISPQSDSGLAWFAKYTRKEEPADLAGLDVFDFLFKLALDKTQS